MLRPVLLSASAGLVSLASSCSAPTQEELSVRASSKSTTDLCLEAETGLSEVLKISAMNELIRREAFSDTDLQKIKEGTVYIGMREDAAICAWNAYLVNHSISAQSDTKQYKGINSYSYFFVDGETGRVEYISA